MQIILFLTLLLVALKPGLPVGFPRQPLGPTVPSCFPGNDTFHFEHVKGGKAASYNLGVRMNGIPEHWLSLKQISYCAFHIRNLLQRVRMWDHSRGLPLSQFFKKTHCTNSFGRKLLTNAMDFFFPFLCLFFFFFLLNKDYIQLLFRGTITIFLEKEMAAHSSVLAWSIPWTEKPGRLQSMGSHRVGHNWSDLAAAAALLFCVKYNVAI